MSATMSASPKTVQQPPTLLVNNLQISYGRGVSKVTAVRGVSFEVARGETLGIVGESGSGKSTTVLGTVGLLPSAAKVSAGQVIFQGQDLLNAPATSRRNLLGAEIGIVYQDALRALNPVMKVGKQLQELLRAHGQAKGAAQEVVNILQSVGIPDPKLRARSYPHEYSGGMRQRALIGMGLAMTPSLLIADEPTTAVDVTIQAQILSLIKTLAREHNTATLIVSHDLGVIANMCDRVLVMYAGEVVEQGPIDQVFADPKHPYTKLLLQSTPNINAPAGGRLAYIRGQPPSLVGKSQGCAFAARCYAREDRCEVETPTLESITNQQGTNQHDSACLRVQASAGVLPELPKTWLEATDTASNPTSAQPPQVQPTDDSTATSSQQASDVILSIKDVSRIYTSSALLKHQQRRITAVNQVSLTLHRGETVGLVGESGCGKSTLGRLIAGLERADAGHIFYCGQGKQGQGKQQDVSKLRGLALRRYRREAQMIYQDPRSSLNRAKSIAQLLDEPLRQQGMSRTVRATRSRELLNMVGLPTSALKRRPDAFSGGQSQRIAIARALAVGAKLIIADEAVSSLDVSIKGQILNLLKSLQTELDLTLLFISHDLSTVKEVCDRVIVMYLGKVVEVASAQDLFAQPTHPYTEALYSAVPIPDPELERTRQHIILAGDTPSPANPPTGCAFHPRCQHGPASTRGRGRCVSESPELLEHLPGHYSACHFALTYHQTEANKAPSSQDVQTHDVQSGTAG
ncbi:MAG: ABC transporter ATP-binding protein [Deinococcota bacterium]